MALHPDFPVVDGTYQMTEDWQVTLPGKFNRRMEDGSLAIWRPGFTIWTAIWNNDQDETPEQRLDWISNDSATEAFDKETEMSNGLVRYSYRLAESSGDNRQAAFYCFAIGRNGHVQMAIYFDSADDLASAKKIWRSLIEIPSEG